MNARCPSCGGAMAAEGCRRCLLERVLAGESGGLELPAELGGFRLRRRIGQGASGEVWQAFQPGPDREVALKVFLDPRLGDYIVDLIHATRAPKDGGLADLVPLVEYGASPRATIALAQAARAHAYLRGREFVSPDDVKAMAPDVLRHRVLLSFEAEAENVTSDEVIARILAAVPAP